jgi:hypothetical protein
MSQTSVLLKCVTDHIVGCVVKASMSAEIIKNNKSFLELVTGSTGMDESKKLESINNMSSTEATALLEILTNMFYGVLPISKGELNTFKPHKDFIESVIKKGTMNDKISMLKQHSSVVLQVLQATRPALQLIWNK